MVEAGVVKRTDLIKKLGVQLSEFSELRDKSEQYRVMRGEDIDSDVTVCLGSGRCLFPMHGSINRSCPFCLQVPDRHLTTKEIDEIVRRFVGGN